MAICESCGSEHDGLFGSGRFCCISCSNRRKFSNESKEKISKSLKNVSKSITIKKCYLCGKEIFVRENCARPKCDECRKSICINCGETFIKHGTRNKKCEKCRRNVQHSKKHLDELNIFDISTRTITKILKRMNAKCSICSWEESTCDIHHIVEKKNGGTDDLKNLIVVCPNCHRILHTLKKFKKDFLLEKSMFFLYPNWREFYHIKN